jgi:hypothetical protein
MNEPSYFEIQADDLGRATHFYEQIFGWKFIKEAEMPIEYWRIETGGLRGGMLRRPATAPPERSGANAYACSMEVESFDEIAQKIVSSGGAVALPKFAVPGKCWQGYFIDTEGNTFGIFEVDEKAQ